MNKDSKGLPRRKFDGKCYQFYDSYKTKNEAQKEASRLRAKGELIRITHPTDRYYPYYELWARK